MYTLSVAIRFLSSKKSQTFLIILGFAIGISVNIFVGSLIQSLQDDLIQTTVGTQPHITISPVNTTDMIENYDDILATIDEVDGISKVATSLDARAFIVNVNPDSPDDVILRGVDPTKANAIYDFYNSEKFVGNPISGDNQVLIGLDLAESLEVENGDELVIKTNPILNENTTVTIAGVFDLGVAELNSLWVIGNQNTVEGIADVQAKITSINLQVDDIFAADTIADELKAKIDDDTLEIVNWKETNESLLSGLQAQSSSTNIIQVFVLLAVVIAITSILGITVLQKSRQIGILKAMGLDDRGSAMIFLFEGLILGMLGALLGVGVAAFLIWGFNTFAGGENSGLFNIVMDTSFVINTVIIAIISSGVASLLPAKNSSKMEVIDIIRNN
ncbi:MAG: ABC transporter permease [Candidatus Heimdallarchaeota archaeon]|nr:ABC transporter permease [Candidatus Heimdallarchaeota archaeon]